ncbi:hypothetical protein [Acaryochloris marina]|uniref:hypothetical protein n=1 Tax=Acaryochloris marina TaxID=155978 RepID=UPI00164F0829|nr:hypothetical protein [Acaryochloris marina]
MPSLHSAIRSLGVLIAVSSVSLPVWAAPQSSNTTASSLGEPIIVSPNTKFVEPTPATKLIEDVNSQLKGIEISRRLSPQPDPSFQWQSELQNNQRRSDPGYQFFQSKF